MNAAERLLYVVRHGATDWNQSGRIQGHMDIPLNKTGRAQARLASIRLAALGQLPCIFVFTHDSMGLGEDGPTHQPVEHLASLRAIPGLITLRPADANEAVEGWRVIAGFRHEPVALILTRQAVPTLDGTKYAAAEGVRRGAYVLADATTAATGVAAGDR